MRYERRSERFCPQCSSGLAPRLLSGKLEVEMVAHGDGAFFAEHSDTLLEGQKFVIRRIISAVYYFHRLPKSFTGGILRIYPLAGREKSDAYIEPVNDTLIFFPSWFRTRSCR